MAEERELSRDELSPATVALADVLLARLGLTAGKGRVELEFRNGETGPHLVQLRRHEIFDRLELASFDE